MNEAGDQPGTGIHSEHLYFPPTYLPGDLRGRFALKVQNVRGGQTWGTTPGMDDIQQDCGGWVSRVQRPIRSMPRRISCSSTRAGCGKRPTREASWTPVSKGITAPEMLSVAVDPANAQKIYAGTGGPGSGYFYRSTDGGQSWNRGSSVLIGGSPDYTFGEVSDLAVDPNNSQKIYLAGYELLRFQQCGPDVYRSGGSAAPRQHCSTPPGSANTVYVGSSFPGYGIYKSTNGGANFDAETAVCPCLAAVSVPSWRWLMIPMTPTYCGPARSLGVGFSGRRTAESIGWQKA